MQLIIKDIGIQVQNTHKALKEWASGDVETIYLYSASAGLFYESGYKPVLLPEQ
jgi:hypothetical protein